MALNGTKTFAIRSFCKEGGVEGTDRKQKRERREGVMYDKKKSLKI